MVACPERELYTHVGSRSHKGDHLYAAGKETRHCSGSTRAVCHLCVCSLNLQHSSPGHGAQKNAIEFAPAKLGSSPWPSVSLLGGRGRVMLYCHLGRATSLPHRQDVVNSQQEPPGQTDARLQRSLFPRMELQWENPSKQECILIHVGHLWSPLKICCLSPCFLFSSFPLHSTPPLSLSLSTPPLSLFLSISLIHTHTQP